jgi:hypothetical protein
MPSIDASIKKRGRPATGKGQQVVVRLQPEPLAKLDAWREAQPDQPSRPEAVRRIIDDVLAKGRDGL